MGADYRSEYEISLKDLYSKTADRMDRKTKDLEKGIDRVNSRAESMGRTMRRVGGMIVAAFSVSAIRSFAQETEKAALSMEKIRQQFSVAMGGAEQGGKAYTYVRSVANDLGLELESTADSFAKINAAARGTKLEGKGAAEVFEGVAVASTTMRLSGEQTEGAMRALEQMLSKGKVQAEELRGQLGERIPGAFQIAARSMNMTTAELDKFMADGKLISEDFLPAFAAQLKKEFGDSLPEAMASSTAAMNRQKNEIFETEAAVGKALVPVMHAFRQVQLAIIKGIGQGIKFYKENQTLIHSLAVAVGILTTAYYVNAAASAFMALKANFYTFAVLRQVAANGLLIGSIRGIGMAINTALGPIGWISSAIAAVSAGVMYAWNTFEGFRGAVYGVWEAVKQVFVNIWDFFKRYFSPVLEAIKAVQEGRWTDAAQAAGTALLRLNPATAPAMLAASAYKDRDKLTKGIGDAYSKGRAEGIASFRKDKEGEKAAVYDASKYQGEGGMGSGSGSGGSGAGVGSALSQSSKVEAKRPQNIYITIDTLGDIKLTTNTVREGANEIKRLVQEALIGAVNDVTITTK